MLLSCSGLVSRAEDEGLPSKLPGGVFLQKKVEVSASECDAIGRKLGGKISGLTQHYMQVQGSPVQVNAITAADESAAKAIHGSLLKIKPPLYSSRRGKSVFEVVVRGHGDALARKASYELGLVAKPSRVTYRVEAELASIDRADYMACNVLFEEFLMAGASPADPAGTTQPAPESISSLAAKFKFGRTLVLRQASLTTVPGSPARYSFKSAAKESEVKGGATRFEFVEQQSVRYGVPFIPVVLEIPVSDTGVSKAAEKPSLALTAATEFWPVSDPKIKALANQITRDKAGVDAKVNAIIEWLAPGRNIKYSGQTGSRWGTAKVFEQRFGRCWDFADCFVTLCRAAGIPARQVAGWLYGTSGHVWAEYYRDGIGWQQVDATGGGVFGCGIYHVAYFTTEDGEMPIAYISMPKIEIVSTQP